MIDLDKNLFIRVIEHALKHNGNFKYLDIIESSELNLNDWEKNIIDRHFLYACNRYNHSDNITGETVFLFIDGRSMDHKSPDNNYLINTDAQFKYLDYRELVFARATAKEAKRTSTYAIILSMVAIIVSVLTPYFIAKFMTQNVIINQDQILDMKNELLKISNTIESQLTQEAVIKVK